MRRLIDDGKSIGALAAERPALIPLFEKLRLDFCCGGSMSLAESCARRGLDPHTVIELIEAIDRVGPSDAEAEGERDWRQAGIGEICDHIVSVHHDGLRDELPRIAELWAKVVRAHGEGRPELVLAERVFATLRGQLEPHLAEEEERLFPACRALARDGAFPDGFGLSEVERHEDEHADVGRRLAALRELVGGYDQEQALCSTHRALLGALADFEADMHRHVHEENNVLFSRMRELAALTARDDHPKEASDAHHRPRPRRPQ